MNAVDNFWENKKVLVTGGQGFLGSRLITFLLAHQAAVVSVARRHSDPSTGDALTVECDVANSPDALRALCQEQNIDTIFHLAASTTVRAAADSPADAIANNINGALNVLETARVNKIARVVIASSDKAYGDHSRDQLEPVPYREDYSLRGADAYGASKASVDLLAQTYARQFKVPVVVARACNIYGPGDLNFSRLIPRTIMCLLGKRPPIINRGNNLVKREYMYVDDAVAAYAWLGANIAKVSVNDTDALGAYGKIAFNIGHYTGAELSSLEDCPQIQSVTDIVTRLRAIVYDTPAIVKDSPDQFIENPDQYLDASKLRALGFTPRVTWGVGLHQTVEWYKDNYERLKEIAEPFARG